ncbi:low molecular weight protein-tyrosine-phosphatase [Arcobacter sp. F2176]|uniref:low molecular weight protein-tyrosine-phosphatase n=1 Tax=Arcobacter sp. F2176 TaxID=2044511 RepID=UPI00100AACC6|nr:low molecular weight protein-tyrosine-phosphatase [Arcobacter sp. F2176]RXJ81519.1 protein tyrosine phosphatase [Arcobacter sp. F2176]
MKVLFVCLGNICRSPLAEAIAKEYAKKNDYNIEVDSCGTGSWHIGEAPCPDSQKIAKIKGLDISNYKARQVKKEDFKKFDLIVGLDSKNIASLRKLGCKNPLLIGDFGYEGKDVPDPYFFDGFEGFDKVFEMIETCVKNLIKEKIEK